MASVEVSRAGTAKNKLAALDASARAGLLSAGVYLVNRTQRTFQLFAPRGHASGKLIRSLGVSPVMFLPGQGIYRCRVGPGVDYSWWVHQGTGPKAGHGPRKQPPIEAIEAWVREKGLVPKFQTLKVGSGGASRRIQKRRKAVDIRKAQRDLAFMIARKIGREGTKPFPFLSATFKAVKPDLEKIILSSMIRGLRSNG